MRTRRQFCVAAAALFCLPLTPAARAQDARPPNATGKWQWSFTCPDGQTIQSTADLKQNGNRLTGTSVLSTGEKHEISNGKIEGNMVSFEITRERAGQKVTVRYSGKLDAESIKGKLETPQGGETRSFDWEAKRVKDPK